MSQGTTGLHPRTEITIADSPHLDSFSRLRTSAPNYVFDAQFTYNLRPLLFEQLTSGTGATISFDSTNRCATLAFSSTPTGGYSYMQTFEHFHYQPGRSQSAAITFNFGGGVANVTKFAGLSNGTNGIEFQLNGTTAQFMLRSGTSNGNQTVAQASWNLDKLDGTGISGLTLDLTKCQILVIDLQALYVGRVRVGFDIGGRVYYAHAFSHANSVTSPYIQTANLPIRAGMSCTGTVTTTMQLICMSVCSEGGDTNLAGLPVSFSTSLTAGNGTATHAFSLRPSSTYSSIDNRSKIVVESLEILGGLNPVKWELVHGQAISGTTTYTAVNAANSSMEYNTAGTLSGTPSVVLATGFVSSSASARGSTTFTGATRVVLALNAAGAARLDGTLTLILTGVGGNSACQVAINWREIR